MPTTTYFTDQLLGKSSAEEVRQQLQTNIVPASVDPPANPVAGQIYLDTTPPARFYGWNGTSWVALN